MTDKIEEQGHKRGCEGRNYACTCGYDDRVEAELARLRSSSKPMADGGETPMTAAEEVLAWLLIEKIGVPDDVTYSPDQAQEIIARHLDRAKELDQIADMLAEGQGDDDGPAILPEFQNGSSVYAKVEACLHLLERRRDVIAGCDRLRSALEDAPDRRHFEILAEAMAEVKATSDGLSYQPIADIVAGCLEEIAALSLKEEDA